MTQKTSVQPFTVVELKLSSCGNTFGVAPCTATGEKCYNTRATCKDAPNFNATTKSDFLCSAVANFPKAQNFIPCIVDVDDAPTTITGGRGLGDRAKVSITLQDLKHNDFRVDPYLSDRTHDTTQGTFLAKYLARNLYYQGREVIVYHGNLETPFNLNNLTAQRYIFEDFTNPDSSGRAKITLKDIIKKIDNKRAIWPAQSSGELSAAVAPGVTTISLKSGQAASYTNNEHIAIGKEVMLVTNITGDDLTVTRSQWNTPDESHSIDAKVQQCKTYTATNIVDIIYDLLTGPGGIPASFINSTDWDAEKTDWVPAYNLTALIPKPTGVETLINELCVLGMLDLWEDAEAQTIRLKASSPYRLEQIEINDSHIIERTLKPRDLPARRLSRVWVRFGLVNPLLKLDEETNIARGYALAESDEESADLYGEIRAEIITTRWLRDTAADRDHAFSLVNRLLSRFKNNPKEFKFDLPFNSPVLPKTGDVIKINASQNQDQFGAPITQVAQVMKSHPNRRSGRINFVAMAYDSAINTGTPLNAITISADQYNYNLWLAVGSPPSAVTIDLTIDAGIKLCSTSVGVASLIIGSFAAGSIINITNSGVVMGAGGDGGAGGGRLTRTHWKFGEPQPPQVQFYQPATPGAVGGNAIQGAPEVTINITNTNGLIAAGNGGKNGNFDDEYYNTYEDAADDPIPLIDATGGDGGDGCDPGNGGAGLNAANGTNGTYNESTAGLGYNPGSAINSPAGVVNIITAGTIQGAVISA